MRKKRHLLTRIERFFLKLILIPVILCLLYSGWRYYFKDDSHAADVDSSNISTANILKKKSIQLDVPLLNQLDEPSLYNGCEVTSLAMLLNYRGISVTKNELAQNIAVVPLTDENGNYGDPNQGFVGSIDGSEKGYSVYHGPIAKLAQSYVGKDLKVVDLSNHSFNTLLNTLSNGNPVWVITTVNYAATDDMETWQTANGEVEISWSVHSVVVTGYDENYIYVNDPYGEKDKKVDRTSFKQAWIQMGRQAVTIQKTT